MDLKKFRELFEEVEGRYFGQESSASQVKKLKLLFKLQHQFQADVSNNVCDMVDKILQLQFEKSLYGIDGCAQHEILQAAMESVIVEVGLEGSSINVAINLLSEHRVFLGAVKDILKRK